MRREPDDADRAQRHHLSGDPSNIVQALDAKTGDLIWETRVGPDQAPGYGGIRSIAIAQDKIFLPTSDAHMVALDRAQRQDPLGHAGLGQAARRPPAARS